MYYWRYRVTDLWLNLGWALAHWRRRFALFWYGGDKTPWLFVTFAAAVVMGLGFALQTVISYQEERRKRVRDFHKQSLVCLARNIYFEARGEPVAGQYAVAEVTMNRRASRRYPHTVCGVVYQKNWDPLRGRYVGAFSWTEFDTLPDPRGEEWQRALAIAEAVYYERYTPALQGATHFHANYIKPDWARQKHRVAKIGRHIFYK
jgi:spore germination cell wall hydrolase CwlJ-like protein